MLAQPGATQSVARGFARRFLTLLVLTQLSLCVLLLGTAGAADAPTAGAKAVSQTVGGRALASSRAALYAKNDPWKAYLAAETVCPGGERTDAPIAKQVSTIACLVNFARTKRGLSRLTVRSVLNRASIKKAREIVRCANFSHDPCGQSWTSTFTAVGYGGGYGENLYIATGPLAAPRVAVDAWLNSAPHRRNLFNQEWREQGIAMVKEPFNGHPEVSLWVNVLGVR